jgi:hypothetical protein
MIFRRGGWLEVREIGWLSGNVDAIVLDEASFNRNRPALGCPDPVVPSTYAQNNAPQHNFSIELYLPTFAVQKSCWILCLPNHLVHIEKYSAQDGFRKSPLSDEGPPYVPDKA